MSAVRLFGEFAPHSYDLLLTRHRQFIPFLSAAACSLLLVVRTHIQLFDCYTDRPSPGFSVKEGMSALLSLWSLLLYVCLFFIALLVYLHVIGKRCMCHRLFPVPPRS
jgi:hypothetical protein